VWQFTPTPSGVLVHTEESWTGEPVSAQAASLQPLLDGAIRAWLGHLKAHAEAVVREAVSEQSAVSSAQRSRTPVTAIPVTGVVLLMWATVAGNRTLAPQNHRALGLRRRWIQFQY
jgi:hypothetical protein